MKLSAYFRDRRIIFWIYGLSLILSAVFLAAMDVPVPLILAVEFLFGSGILSASLYDFGRKKKYYDHLTEIYRELDEKSYLSEMIEEPDFLDGRILYEIVKTNGKYLNDMISEQRQEMMEYREYVETWVHEVKTPIAVARLMIENHNNEVHAGMEEEVDKIEHYVEQMLYYSKSGSLESDYRIRPVSLKELCMGAVQKHSKMLVAEKVMPRFVDLDVVVLTDLKWMEFILGQVIANAVKYRDQSRNSRLEFSASPQSPLGPRGKNIVDLTVRDNGIGIPEQDLSRVFLKGFTGENGRRYSKSTGMGLYLCRSLCGKMGTGMEIRSEPGQWTEVHFYLKEDSPFVK